MRLFDMMKPAMEWSEAAMLPARVRTLSGGAALRQVSRLEGMETAAPAEEKEKPAAAGPVPDEGHMRSLRRAAYRQIRFTR